MSKFQSRMGRMLRVLMWAFAFSLLSQAPASAGSATFEGLCKIPIIDKTATTFEVEASIPAQWNRNAPPSSIDWKLKMVSRGQSGAFWWGFTYAAELYGKAWLTVSVTQADGSPVLFKVPIVLDRVVRPSTPPYGDVTMTGSSSVPPGMSLKGNGTTTFKVEDVMPVLSFSETRNTRALTSDFDGNPYTQGDTDPYTTDILCRTNAGENTTVATTNAYSLVDSAANAFVGYATVPTLSRAPVPVRGTLNTVTTVSSGSVIGSVEIADVWGRLLARTPDAIPTSGRFSFARSGSAVGRLSGGKLTLSQTVRVKITGAKLFGTIPIELGNDCQSKSLSTVNYTSIEPDFSFERGGTLEAKFAIGDLNGCAGLAELFSPITANTDNTLRLTVKPQ